jgi:poly-gamma-glutamate system protein
LAYQLDRKRQMSLVIMTILAIACIFVLENTTTDRKVSEYDTKKAACDLAARAFIELQDYQTATFGPLTTAQLRNDPAGTYLLTSLPNGRTKTAIVTAAGQGVASKQRVINPNFAAVFVDYFSDMGLERGDQVAVSLTASYPGFNINAYAAIEAMGLRPTVITAVGGSPFGATNPEFTWLDMERVLAEKNIFSTRSRAAAPGGASDMGGSLSDEGRQLIWDAIARNNVEAVRSNNLEDAIEKRMAIYNKGNADYKAYINVSSSMASLGSSLSQVPIDTGIHLDLWSRTWPRKGTMILMADKGMPVLHLASSLELAREYNFPTSHEEGFVPEVGEGAALTYEAYNVGIAAALLVVYLVLTLFVTLPDLKNRFFGPKGAEG